MYEKIKKYIIPIAAAVLLFAGGYLFGRTCISDNGNGNADVGEQVRNSQEQQHTITEQSNEIREQLAGSQQQVREIKSIIADTGNAISDIEQILAGVKQRGTTEAK